MKRRRTNSFQASFFKAILYNLRTIIHLRKPDAISIDYIPLLVQQKPVLLLNWNFAYSYSLIVKPTKKTYRQASGSYILRPEENCEEVTLIIRSLWRGTTVKIELVPVPATPAMLALLEQDPAVFISLHMPTPVKTVTAFETRRMEYKLPSFNIKPTISTFYIDADQLNINQ